MKKTYFLTALLSLTASATYANQLLEITEIGETIVATLNGSPLAVTLTGPIDGWTIELPSTISLTPSGPYYLGEPEAAAKYNEVSITQPTFLTWNSDLAVGAQSLGSPFPSTFITITDAGTYGSGTNRVVSIDLKLADVKRSVPETGSTIALLGISLMGLLAAAGSRRQLAK